MPLTERQLVAANLKSLWRRYLATRDEGLRNQLWDAYQNMVKAVAVALHSNKGMPSEVTVDELVSDGQDGLLEALTRFDPARNTCFKTYAGRLIVGRMLDGLRNRDWVPRLARFRQAVVDQARRKFFAGNGRQPDPDELRCTLELSKRRFKPMVRDSRVVTTTSLNQQCFEGEACNKETQQIHLLQDRSVVFAQQKHDGAVLLAEVLPKLFGLERAVIFYYYGHNMTLREAGIVMGISESRASQIHSNAITALRRQMGTGHLPRPRTRKHRKQAA